MDYVIASYRSRNVTVKVYNGLVSHGVTCALVSTPRQANVGCGLSVKMSSSSALEYQDVLSNIETFAGLFRVRTVNGKTIVTRL